jgi:hypothetical protein
MLQIFLTNLEKALGMRHMDAYNFAVFFETFIKTSGGTGPVMLEQPSESCRC